MNWSPRRLGELGEAPALRECVRALPRIGQIVSLGIVDQVPLIHECFSVHVRAGRLPRRRPVRASFEHTLTGGERANHYRPNFISLGGYDGLHLIYEALKRSERVQVTILLRPTGLSRIRFDVLRVECTRCPRYCCESGGRPRAMGVVKFYQKFIF